MKKKRFIWVAIALLIILTVAIGAFFLLNGNIIGSETTDPETFFENSWEDVTDLDVDEQADGTVEVTLTAPDYGELVKRLSEQDHDTITIDLLAKAIKRNPKVVKEYQFIAPSSDEADIKDAWLEQIAYEMVSLTLNDMTW